MPSKILPINKVKDALLQDITAEQFYDWKILNIVPDWSKVVRSDRILLLHRRSVADLDHPEWVSSKHDGGMESDNDNRIASQELTNMHSS